MCGAVCSLRVLRFWALVLSLVGKEDVMVMMVTNAKSIVVRECMLMVALSVSDKLVLKALYWVMEVEYSLMGLLSVQRASYIQVGRLVVIKRKKEQRCRDEQDFYTLPFPAMTGLGTFIDTCNNKLPSQLLSSRESHSAQPIRAYMPKVDNDHCPCLDAVNMDTKEPSRPRILPMIQISKAYCSFLS